MEMVRRSMGNQPGAAEQREIGQDIDNCGNGDKAASDGQSQENQRIALESLGEAPPFMGCCLAFKQTRRVRGT